MRMEICGMVCFSREDKEQTTLRPDHQAVPTLSLTGPTYIKRPLETQQKPRPSSHVLTCQVLYLPGVRTNDAYILNQVE